MANNAIETRTEPLSDEERRNLAAEEMVLSQVQDAMLGGWQALLRIRDQRLYREQGTFEEYLAKRWPKFGRSAVYQRLGQVQMLAELGDVVDLQTVKGSQLDALKAFGPELRQEIWQRAQDTAPGRRPTAAWIERVGREVQEEKISWEDAAEEEEADDGEAIDGAAKRTEKVPLHPIFRAQAHCRKLARQLGHVVPEEADATRALELAGELAEELRRLGERVR